MDDSTIQADIASLRSTASSIISTGTKTSIGTLAQPYLSQEGPSSSGIDVHLGGHRNFRITARPGSVLSISSFDSPAPPYEAYASTNASVATLAPSTPRQGSSRTPSPIPPLDPSTTPSTASSSATSTPQASPAFALPSPPSASASPSGSRTPSPPLSPTLPDPTTLSRHYTLVVRTIDANHRAELARLAAHHAAALAHTRHDIDAAYRPLLRARTADVERIREDAAAAVAALTDSSRAQLEARDRAHAAEMARLAAEMQQRERECTRRTERATHEIEDVWEGRWRDRLRVAGEEMERAVARAREEEGAAWVGVLAGRWPERRGEWEGVREGVRARAVRGRGEGGWEGLRGEEWAAVWDGEKVVREREGRWEGVWEGTRMIKGRKGRWEIRKGGEEEGDGVGVEGSGGVGVNRCGGMG